MKRNRKGKEKMSILKEELSKKSNTKLCKDKKRRDKRAVKWLISRWHFIYYCHSYIYKLKALELIHNKPSFESHWLTIKLCYSNIE